MTLTKYVFFEDEEEEIVTFVVPLTIDIPFDNDLNDPSSSAFRKLAGTLVKDLTPLLCDGLTGNGQTCIVVIIGFSAGSTRRRQTSTNVEAEARISGGDVDEAAVTTTLTENAEEAENEDLEDTGVRVSNVKVADIVVASKVGKFMF